MSRARSDNLLLIAATTILILAAQRYFQPIPAEKSVNPAVSPIGKFTPELSEHDHGRRSRTPFQIPFAGWKDILWRTYARINDDRLLATAGGVVFFGLMLPDGSFQIVQDQIARVLDKGSIALGWTFLFGLALAVWSANAGVKAVIDALNVAYEEREKRSFAKLNLTSLAFTTGGIAALLLMVGAVVAYPLALDHLGLAPESRFIVSLARWPLLFVLLLFALGVLYRFGPSRRAARWEWLSVGTLAAGLLWIAGSSALSWYLQNFANYNATYGSLGAAIGLMMWMWMSAIIVLCAAEFNSEIERQTAVDTTVGRPKPLGARGAVMADSLGPAVPPPSKQH
jgi:membrane protein